MTSRRIALILVWTLPSSLFLAATAIVFSAFRIPPPDRLGEAERSAIMAPLRAAIEGGDAPRCSVHRTGGPIIVSVWIEGRTAARVEGSGVDLGAATDVAAKLLRGRGLASDRARIQVDIVTGRAPLGGGQWLFDALAVPGVGDMLAINPGVEGIGAKVGDLGAMVLPHELVAAKLLSTKRPSEAMQDFAVGVDLKRIALMVGTRLGLHGPVDRKALYRFRTDTFIERPRHEGPPLSLVRGIPAPPAPTAMALREAALEGGRYLIAHLSPDGRYIYQHDLATGVTTDPRSGDYSMPRHAGTTYFLAELYRITKQDWLREPIERAFAHLATLLAAGQCGGTLPDGTPFDCVLDRREEVAHLGSTALTVVALVEYQRATGDTRYLPLAQKLSAWLLYMQRPDGSFRHLYNAKLKKPDDDQELLYYSGETSLALARMYLATGDKRYLDAAERGLDRLVEWYDFFLGGFVYFEEHWTCIAAEAIWPAVQKAKYRQFCEGYATFLRGQQPAVGDFPDEDDLAGSYNVTPFIAPYNTPAGSHTEAMISTYLLGRHHGRADDRIRDQIALTLQYVLGQQIRPDRDFAVIGPGEGGVPISPIERTVRIDYVQHVCSAMIRASEWIDSPGP